MRGPLALALALSSWALAGELLLPNPPVSPDGFEAVLLGGGKPEVQGGTAEASALGQGRWFIRPEVGAKAVTIKSPESSVTLAVGPPGSVLSLSITPAAPVKGRDTEAALEVLVKRPDGQLDEASAPPVIRANVGTVGALEKVAPGRYRARYQLPKTRYPEVAVIVAFAAWPHPQSVHGATGALRVPLSSAVDLPGRTEAQADISLVIGGTTFGPTRAGADGSFTLPVVVPPGYGLASGTAVDRLGNRRTVKIDLHLPRTDQLACVANPPRLPADGASKARVLCAISDVYGGVTRGAKVQLSAAMGQLSAQRELGEGLVEWTWTAPAAVGAGKAPLTATWRQAGVESREELSVELLGSPVSRLELAQPPTPFVHAGGAWHATVRALDAAGKPLAGARVKLAQNGTAHLSDEQGTAEVEWRVAREAKQGPTSVAVEGSGPGGTEPARLFVWAEGQTLFAEFTDLAGRLVPRQPLFYGRQALETGDDGVVALGPVGAPDAVVAHGRWSGLQEVVRTRDGVVLPGRPPPGRASLVVPVEVDPPAPVVVRLERKDGAWAWWVESPEGALLADREVEITERGQKRRERSGRPIRLDAAAGWVSIVDVLTHVGMLAEVPR